MLDITAYGRIASDIHITKSLDKKHLYVNFLLATHKNKKTTFIRCVAFDSIAMLLQSFFTKGDRIIIKGDLISDDYKGSKYVFKIKVREFEFVENLENHKKNKERQGVKNGKRNCDCN